MIPARAQSLAALAGIVILAIFLSPVAADGSRVFLQLGNLTDILRQISLIGMIGLAMTFVILTGGIDLSVGSILALATAVAAMCLTRMGASMSYGAHIALAIGLAVAVAGLTGLVNGVVIATVRIQPFIVTLASMIGVRGLAKWITNNENIDIGFGRDVAAHFADIFRAKAIVIGSYACAAAVFWLMLARTVFGRHVRAIGDNEKAARYAGLPIRGTKIWVYTISGMLSGFAGVLYAAENHQGNPNAGVAYELDAIAAVVIGGTPLSGGRGSISGTIVGSLIMGVLTNMLRLKNVDSNLEMMIKAVIIVLAVAVQRERESA
ncbi:MAG TPA: ABC transporter permease [Candidatus Sulfopaludibacter sp.]|jgi:ribose transport system permease protein|nr:ABC transporter permease [Candidatus Sulfopaludibacter sp.]